MDSQPKNARSWYDRYQGFFGEDLQLKALFELPVLLSRLDEKMSSDAAIFKILSFLFNFYPSKNQIEHYLHVFRVSGKIQAIELVLEDRFFILAWNDPTPPSWFFLPDNSLLVDVSTTYSYPYRTGIQRVVYELARNIVQESSHPYLITSTPLKPTQFNVLSDREVADFVQLSTVAPQKKSTLWQIKLISLGLLKSFSIASLAALKSFLGSAYQESRTLLVKLSPHRSFYRDLLRLVDRKKSRLKKFNYLLKPQKGKAQSDNLYLFKAKVILPEIIQEEERVDFYRTLRRYTDTKLLMIIYDLGPFTFPEYSAVGKDFTYYLSLLRVVDHVSCISRSVMDDVETYIKLIFREVSNPLSISADLLAADFSKIESLIEVPSPRLQGLVGSSFALVVGTFEPRKNHWNILRAFQAYLHKHPVTELKLVFAGNPGWKNEHFLEELDKAKKIESRIIQFLTLTDQELAWLYQNCVFSIFCSHLEGFGLPILESLRWKKPVITSSRGSMAELAKKFGGCLLVDPNDPTDICKAIEVFASEEQVLQNHKNSIDFSGFSSWKDYANTILNHLSP